jgi:hypothetical protein
MKKLLLSLFILVLPFYVYSQISKGNIQISLNGNFIKTNNATGVTTNYLNSDTKQLVLDGTLEYFVSPNTMLGIGLEYTRIKENTLSHLYFNNFMQIEEFETESKILLPHIGIAHHFRIVDNLFLSPYLNIGFGRMKAEYNTIIAGRKDLQSGDYVYSDPDESTSGLRGQKDDTESDYLNANVCPQMNYYVSQNFGVYLELGGINYSISDWDNEQWLVDFNPRYWSLGFKIRI